MYIYYEGWGFENGVLEPRYIPFALGCMRAILISACKFFVGYMPVYLNPLYVAIRIREGMNHIWDVES